MVVQHNLRAMNSNRMLGLTTATQAKSTERLSSGYKINRAADDAAGLSISEKMRKQVRGLTQASMNAQDGISAVQTAEGALTEVHDMLQRMNELAVKAANGTNSEDDRTYIQNEVDQLVKEIDRVAETTKFNETYLLKGDDSKIAITETSFEKADVSSLSSVIAEGSKLTEKNDFNAETGKFSMNFTSGLKVGDTWADKEVVADATAVGSDTATKIALADAKTAELAALNTAIGALADVASGAAEEGKDFEIQTADSLKTEYIYAAAKDLSLHVGADSTIDNKINLSIKSMSAAGLHVEGIKVDGADANNATAAIDTISDAIQKVSAQRSELGAVQNRLEHTINNLDNVVENTTAAESQIRDTDMASEMVKHSNNNILAQAGQAMLAQANQANQGVLSLLQ